MIITVMDIPKSALSVFLGKKESQFYNGTVQSLVPSHLTELVGGWGGGREGARSGQSILFI